MYGKEVRVFLKGQAKDKYLELDQTILNSFERIKLLLKENPQFGNPIAKRIIPKQLELLGIQNLYRVELANYWRMLYTIEGTENTIYVFVLCIMNHKEYNKLFGY